MSLWVLWRQQSLGLQAAAITNGIHQLLLNCVADTHALLALKAFQPTQPASAPKMAQVARTDHKQARTAARAVRAAAKAARSDSVGMHTVSASGEYPHGLHTSGDMLKVFWQGVSQMGRIAVSCFWLSCCCPECTRLCT